jgi:hypothetical protein
MGAWSPVLEAGALEFQGAGVPADDANRGLGEAVVLNSADIDIDRNLSVARPAEPEAL